MMIPSNPTGRRSTRVLTMTIVSPDFKRDTAIGYLVFISYRRIGLGRLVISVRL